MINNNKKKILEVKNVSLSYSKKQIIDDVNLCIYEGETISIIGHNGCGKTTLGKILAFLIQPDKGEFFFDNKKVSNNYDNLQKYIGFVFQNPDNQFFGSTVEDDIAFGLENHLVQQDQMSKLINDVAKEIGILDLLKKDVQQLSGGQKQQVSIADILVLKPKVIIFDESFSMLDFSNKKKIFELIKTIKKKYKLTIIYITHDLEDTLDSDRVFLLEHGKIFLSGSPNYVFQQSEKLQQINFETPFIFQLNQRLINKGIIKKVIFDIEQLVKIICK
ncbi:MAG: ATP-binding cassette domain-containing protein [Bacilli bacterium]|nr:ATP-binding cassette domain-containing protein [Bacilli bacterium]